MAEQVSVPASQPGSPSSSLEGESWLPQCPLTAHVLTLCPEHPFPLHKYTNHIWNTLPRGGKICFQWKKNFQVLKAIKNDK